MIPTLIFLLIITVLGTAIYLYLRREQNKLFPKDKYSESPKSSNKNAGKFKKYRFHITIEYLWLVGLSVLSGLLISSFYLILYLLPNIELGILIILPLAIIVQYILIIPITGAVYTLVSLMHSNTHPISRAGIPLIFNIIGANAFFIISFLTDLQSGISSSYLHSNIHVAIEDETVAPWVVPNPAMQYVAYRATLHIKSNIRNEFPYIYPKEIPDMSFVLSTYDHHKEDIYDWGIAGYTITVEEIAFWSFNRIGNEEFDIGLNIPIYEKDLHCDGKPLYLFYSVDGDNFNLISLTSKSINQQLQQIACNSG